MTHQNPMEFPKMNALIAGGGGIGAALIEALLQRPNIDRVFCLQRREQRLSDDPRYTALQFEATDPDSVEAACAVVAEEIDELHLVMNTVGLLHHDWVKPEKRLRDVSARALMELAAVNAFFLPILAQCVSGLLRHSNPALMGSLSARVGSITDNAMGGWYSYRASKAAHNMLLRTLAREWRISHKQLAVVALHPGTVKTSLSEPYTPTNYSKRVLSPQECADSLLQVMAGLQPEDSGSFYSWTGEQIPW